MWIGMEQADGGSIWGEQLADVRHDYDHTKLKWPELQISTMPYLIKLVLNKIKYI